MVSAQFIESNRRQILIGVLVVVAVLVVANYAYSSFQEYRQNVEDSIDIKEVKHLKLTRLISKGDEYRQEHDLLQSFIAEFRQKHLITASSQSLAEAELQKIITQKAQQHGVELIAVRPLQSENRDGLKLLRLSLNSRAQIDQIRDFMLDISRHQKLFFFDEVEIKILNRAVNQLFYFNATISAVSS
jgi:hypothetical protein